MQHKQTGRYAVFGLGRWKNDRRQGPAPGFPETLHGAPIQGSCYGRENITVSRLL